MVKSPHTMLCKIIHALARVKLYVPLGGGGGDKNGRDNDV